MRFPLPLGVLLGLALLAGAPARACPSDLLPAYIGETAGQIEMAARSETVQDAQIHLRRAARNLFEAEFQLATCDCSAGGASVAEATAAARRASLAADPDDMVNAMDDLLVLFDSALALLSDDSCR